MKTILIIEDDTALLRGLVDNFEHAGFRVISASDGETGLTLALGEKPDLIILDIMLPLMNGYEVCQIIREEKLLMPIIMLTAKGEESDIVLGLNIGADDYVTKPFGIRELLARAKAFLRRQSAETTTQFSFDNFILDLDERKLTKDSEEIRLTPKEFNLLKLLLESPGRAFTRDEILHRVWGDGCFVTTRSVDRCITTIRNKIEKEKTARYIHTVREIGYKFVLPE